MTRSVKFEQICLKNQRSATDLFTPEFFISSLEKKISSFQRKLVVMRATREDEADIYFIKRVLVSNQKQKQISTSFKQCFLMII